MSDHKLMEGALADMRSGGEVVAGATDDVIVAQPATVFKRGDIVHIVGHIAKKNCERRQQVVFRMVVTAVEGDQVTTAWATDVYGPRGLDTYGYSHTFPANLLRHIPPEEPA